MPRKISPSQLRSKLKQFENKQRQQINQAVRQHNRKVRQVTNDINRSINDYHRKIRSNQARIKNELSKLRRHSTKRYSVYHTSVFELHEAYTRWEQVSLHHSNRESLERVLNLSEQENANSLELSNALLGFTDIEYSYTDKDLATSYITIELNKISNELHKRWLGALYSLNPKNPDAARHFCTSAREIFSQIFQLKAPDENVFQVIPTCDITKRGNPTMRSKIRFLLHQKGMAIDSFEDFIHKDIQNILELFRVFNDGTHGSSGRFNLTQLYSIKKRVEDGILFLVNITSE